MEIQWSLVIFAAFICWGAGTYVAAVAFRGLLGASERIMRPAFVLSAVAVVVGAVASMTHLGHLDRIFGVLSNPASGIFVEGLSSAVLVVVAAAYLVAAGRKASSGVLRALAVVGVVPALVVVFAVGSSYLMVARPAWDVPALPIASVTAALSMGAVTVLAIDAFTARGARDAAGEERAASRMGVATLALIGIQAVAVAAYAASVATAPYQEASRSAARMLAGDMAPLFWLAVVVLGVAVPFAATLAQRRGLALAASGEAVARSRAAVTLGVAALCMVVAVIAFRVIMFSLGSSIIDFEFTL
ncbi:NrfD/PsrC family molybdoenzyme membrane anchor subunit [Rubneribacter sp.]|nr:polysulfide reductase NrfD [Candidatus Rubneribacter avistercoris]